MGKGTRYISDPSFTQINDSIHVFRNDLYESMAFVTWYVTGVSEAYDIAAMAAKAGVLVDNLLYADVITGDLDGCFSREDDGITNYLPLMYELGLGINLLSILDSLASTYPHIINNDPRLTVIALSSVKFFSITAMLSMQVLRLQGSTTITTETRWKNALRDIRNDAIRTSSSLIDSPFSSTIADLQLAIFSISDQIVDEIEGEINIEYCTRSPSDEEYTFLVLLMESLPKIFLESAAWTLDYALVCLAQDSMNDAYCAAKAANVKLDLAAETLEWYAKEGWVTDSFASEKISAIQQVIEDVDLLIDQLLDELLEDPYWRLWYILGWFFEFLGFILTMFYFN